MRYGVIAENPLERIALATGLIPTPLFEAYAFAFSRALMVATRLGVFDALADGPRTAPEVAAQRGGDARAFEKLLNLLVAMRYLRLASGRYRLTSSARRWLLPNARGVADNILMKFLEWGWMEGLEDFVRSGAPLDVHGTMTTEDWGLYQRGMRAQASFVAPLLARRIPMPPHARRMLDVGGSHGYYSVALCRRYPELRAVVLDLPQAVEQASPLLEAEGMGERVTHRAGDALVDDLGTDAFDVIVSLVHHFDDATNRSLVARAAAALRPGGVLVIGDLLRPDSPQKSSAMDTFFDLYFALTSRSGLWSFGEMADWQRAAGLNPRRPMRLLPGQSFALQVGQRVA